MKEGEKRIKAGGTINRTRKEGKRRPNEGRAEIGEERRPKSGILDQFAPKIRGINER